MSSRPFGWPSAAYLFLSVWQLMSPTGDLLITTILKNDFPRRRQPWTVWSNCFPFACWLPREKQKIWCWSWCCERAWAVEGLSLTLAVVGTNFVSPFGRGCCCFVWLFCAAFCCFGVHALAIESWLGRFYCNLPGGAAVLFVLWWLALENTVCFMMYRIVHDL